MTPEIFRAHPRHPVHKRQIQITASTQRELDQQLEELDRLRYKLKLGLISHDEVARNLGARRRRTVADAAKLAARVARTRATSRRILSFVSAIGARLAQLELHQVDARQLACWEDSLRAHDKARSTIGTAWHTLQTIYRTATKRGWIGATPWGDWKPSTQPSGAGRLEREAARDVGELLDLLRAAHAIDKEREPALLGDLEAKIGAASLLGIRQGEIAGLRWPDVDRSQGHVAVVRQWDGQPLKNRRPACVRALPDLFVMLEDYKRRLRHRGLFAHLGPVFPMRSSEPGRPRAYRGGEPLTRIDVRAVVERANLPHPFRWSAHSFRDTFATLEAHAHGGDLKAVSERTRHASLASLARYLRSRSREPAAPGFQLSPVLEEHEGAPLRALK